MISKARSFSARRNVFRAAAAPVLALCSTSGGAETPLEQSATRLANFETANMLADGRWALQAGTHQTDPGTGTGTGSQLYYGAVDYALTPDLQFGLTAQVIEDSLVKPILGTQPATRFVSYGGGVKYRFVNRGNLQVAVQGAAEYLQFRTALFGTDVANSDYIIGSLHVPITYSVNPNLQFHVTPGVSVFPETINGLSYYGTVASLGAGVTWRASNRLQFFGSVNAPLSGGNTIDTARDITKVPVITAGARYAFTPKVALEGYVTNAIGVTPTTGILTFYPDGTEPLIGLRVIYTPGQDLPNTYRASPGAKLTQR